MGWLYRFSIRRPKTVCVIAGLIILAIAPGALRLRIRTDGHALVRQDDPQVILDREIRDEFGIEDPVVVLIESDDPHGVFNAGTIRLIADLTTAFGGIDGVRATDVSSLKTEHNYRVKRGTLKFRTLLDPLPQTRKELDTLRNDIRNIGLYDGTVIARDDSAASILIGVPAGMDRTDFYTDIQNTIATFGDVPERVRVIGAPVAEALLGTHILEDLGVPEIALGHRVGRAGENTWRLPRNLHEFRVFLGHNIGLVPIAIAIMMVVFWIAFRSVTAAVLPMFEVGACLAVVFGLMGWCDVPIYLTIAVLPVILTAIGVADEIHIFTRYIRELRERPEQAPLKSLTIAMNEMRVPVVKTSVTTAVGFLSFALSPLGPVKAFGVFTAVGIMFCMLWSLAVIPAQLALLDPKRLAGRLNQRTSPHPRLAVRACAQLGTAVSRYRYVVVLLAVLLVVLAPLGVRRIVVQDSWIDGFSPAGGFHQATQTFNAQFLGTHMLLVTVDTGHSVIRGELEPDAIGDHKLLLPDNLVADPAELVGCRMYLKRAVVLGHVEDVSPSSRRQRRWSARNTHIESAVRTDDGIAITLPRRHAVVKAIIRLADGEKLSFEITPQRLLRAETLERIGKLEAFIKAHSAEAVGGVIGPPDYIATTHYMKTRNEERRLVPQDTDALEQLWGDYERIRGSERLRQIVNTTYSRCVTYVFLKNANFVDTQRLMDDIRTYENENLAPHGIALDFAGDVAVSQTLIAAIVTTQVRSLVVSLIGILLMTSVLSRSLIWGVLSVLPCALAVLVNFAVMGMVGMPLGVATSMFAGMTLGIGVDYAIHLLERYRHATARGLDRSAARADAVAHTGPAVLIDAVAVALGFGVMMLSQVPANARLGGLVVLSIAGCLAATLLLLPALLSLGDRGRSA